jgi:hypothetical protein
MGMYFSSVLDLGSYVIIKMNANANSKNHMVLYTGN